jgi:hypothetical protein
MIMKNKDRHILNILVMIALGLFLFFLVPILGIADHPEIWSKTYVLYINIISKVIGVTTTLIALYFFIFYEPKDNTE